jgi:hypothetical protein
VPGESDKVHDLLFDPCCKGIATMFLLHCEVPKDKVSHSGGRKILSCRKGAVRVLLVKC